MQTAMILMTILGCDDSVAQCKYIATAEHKWQTVALCDAASEAELKAYVNLSYPVVVARCEAPPVIASTGTAPVAPPLPVEPEKLADQPPPGLASKALRLVTNALPTKQDLAAIVDTPVHFVTDGYSWVARRITRDAD